MKKLRHHILSLNRGEIILAVYIVLTIALTASFRLYGFPAINQMASTPLQLAQGKIWLLFTSAFIIKGAILPQIAAIAVLGTVGFAIGGAWAFWRTVVIGHFAGTILTYMGLAIAWIFNPSGLRPLLVEPDYGVSLIWCAALGAVVVVAWLRKQDNRESFNSRWISVSASLIMSLVLIYSTGLDRIEHAVAFGLGMIVLAATRRPQDLTQPTNVISPERIVDFLA